LREKGVTREEVLATDIEDGRVQPDRWNMIIEKDSALGIRVGDQGETKRKKEETIHVSSH
jgi:hypothetical protein